MIRKAFKMKLYAGKIAAYAKEHNPIWPELAQVLKEHGVSNYSIFYDEDTNLLFGYAEVVSESQWNAIADSEICQKWWKHMAPLMETNPDNSPLSKNLESVFYLP